MGCVTCDEGHFGSLCFATWRCGFLSAAAALLFAIFFLAANAPPAEALPSYARQTGQPCGTCHTDFAGLTPYGRLFKIQGYTAGGGPYRTTLFPSSMIPPRSTSETLGTAALHDDGCRVHQYASAAGAADRTIQCQQQCRAIDR